LINLYKIKKQHEKEERIYKETIQIFPQLQYPDLNTCPDYAQSLKYQFHLSYLLGEALLKAYNTWYKCGGFLLSKNIKKANKDYQSFQEIFKQFDIFNSSLLLGFIENKALFLKEFSRIKKLLKTHQDYKAILDNIFNNFNYVLENFDLIEAWLLSDDFKQRYKEQNHPYPSLLNPKKLNDYNEPLNYSNIPVELAWQVNLPLPDNYKLVLAYRLASGTGMLGRLFNEVLDRPIVGFWAFGAYENYKYTYSFLSQNHNKTCTVGVCSGILDAMADKFVYLISKKVPIMAVVRDPLETVLTWVNHRGNSAKNYFHIRLNLTHDFKKNMMSRIIFNGAECIDGQWHYTDSSYPMVETAIFYMYKCCLLDEYILPFVQRNFIVHYYDLTLFIPKNIVETVKELCTRFDLQYNQQKLDKLSLELAHGSRNLYVWTLPYILYCHPYDKENKNIDDDSSLSKAGGFHLILVKENFKHYFSNYCDITSKIIPDFDYENLKIYTYENEYHLLHKDKELFEKSQAYMKNIIFFLKRMEKKFSTRLLNMEQLLAYMSTQEQLQTWFKESFIKDITHIKQHRPDIVASWKHSQKFARISQVK
ncbi:DUF2972 domain-containing protein, partial [Campylobacter jejuni]|nr:DUF2972 domain-containing protein [Campylobacter jejuni]